MCILIAEIRSSWSFLILRHVHCMLHKFIYTFILKCRNWYNRDTKHFFHFIYKNGTAIFPYFIHHVESKYHWHIKLHQLHR
jgi:hypothetical protein